MDQDERWLADLVGAVLDGSAAKLDTADAHASDSQRAAIRQLRILARVSELYRTLPTDLRSDETAGTAEPTAQLKSWGRLSIVEEIGRGAYGEVYRARDPRLDRDVALKLLHAPGKAHSDRHAADLVKEGRLLARVRHPNVVSIYDADSIAGRVGLTMEFIEGRTLEHVLRADGPLPPVATIDIGIEVCRALGAVHDAGLLHRDIKAQNVMRQADGRLVLMDFGAGRELEDLDALSVVAGTPLYLAPEIFDRQPASVQSDIYSVGVLLYHLLTGDYPVEGPSLREIANRHRHNERTTLAVREPDLHPALAGVVDRAISRNARDRYATAGDLATALERVRTPAPGTRRWMVAVSAMLVVVLTAGAYWILRPRSVHTSTEKASAPLVTTSSKTALLLFTEANRILEENGDNRAAEALLREAMTDDPSFASAQILLAWALLREQRPPTDYLPVAEQAERLAAGATEGERLFVRGSAFQMRGQMKEACGAYEALVRIQPEHYWGTNNLLLSCIGDEGGDRIARADHLAKRADLRPNDIDLNVRAAWANEFLINNPARAERYLARAEQLQRRGSYSGFANSDSWLRFHHAFTRWLRNDVDEAFNEVVTTVERDDGQVAPAAREDMYVEAGQLMMTLGRLEDAARMFNMITADHTRPGYLALVQYARGDFKRALRGIALYSAKGGPGPISAILGARMGLLDRAQQIAIGPRVAPGRLAAEAILGEVAFQRGQMPLAIEHLENAVNQRDGTPTYFLAAESLAEALVRTGTLEQAIDTLEEASTERQRTYDPGYGGSFAGYTWLRTRVLEAELCAHQDRRMESQRLADEIVKLLAKADSDFPLLQRAKKLLNQ